MSSGMTNRKNIAVVTITNISTMMISLQVKQPGANFYTHEQQARLMPGQSQRLPKDYLLMDQVNNLKAKGMLTVAE